MARNRLITIPIIRRHLGVDEQAAAAAIVKVTAIFDAVAGRLADGPVPLR